MCPRILGPRFGFYKCTRRRTSLGYEVGTKCMMKCRKGFKPVSDSRKKCMEDGGWRGDEGECRPLTCPQLFQPTNGRVEPTNCVSGK